MCFFPSHGDDHLPTFVPGCNTCIFHGSDILSSNYQAMTGPGRLGPELGGAGYYDTLCATCSVWFHGATKWTMYIFFCAHALFIWYVSNRPILTWIMQVPETWTFLCQREVGGRTRTRCDQSKLGRSYDGLFLCCFTVDVIFFAWHTRHSSQQHIATQGTWSMQPRIQWRRLHLGHSNGHRWATGEVWKRAISSHQRVDVFMEKTWSQCFFRSVSPVKLQMITNDY